MSGVGKFLFGGSTSKSSSNPVDATPEELRPLRSSLVTGLNSVINGGQGPAGEPSTQIPGITTQETQNLGEVNQAANDPNRAALLAKTLQGYFLPGQAGGNPFLQSAIEAAQRPTQQALNDTLSRTLPGTFTAAGQQIGGGLRSPNARLGAGSTAFDMAAARAFEGGSNALKDIATNMSFQGYNSERERQQGAISLSQADVNTMIQNLQAQALPRLIETQGVQAGVDQFNKRIASLLQALGIAAGTNQIGTQSQSKGNTEGGAINALKGTAFLPGVGGK